MYMYTCVHVYTVYMCMHIYIYIMFMHMCLYMLWALKSKKPVSAGTEVTFHMVYGQATGHPKAQKQGGAVRNPKTPNPLNPKPPKH